MKNAGTDAGVAGLEAHSTDLEAQSTWALMRMRAGRPTRSRGTTRRRG